MDEFVLEIRLINILRFRCDEKVREILSPSTHTVASLKFFSIVVVGRFSNQIFALGHSAPKVAQKDAARMVDVFSSSCRRIYGSLDT
jgi:hypothetical protein